MSVQVIRGDDRVRAIYIGLVALAAVLIAVATFYGALAELVRRWIAQDEYSHGFFIPAIALWLIWMRRDALVASLGRPSWGGLVLVLLAALMHAVGELSAFFLLSQLGFIVALLGIVLGLGGFPLLRVTFVPIVFLAFAIPLPYFIDSVLSWRLQLISSELGVWFIRLMQVPVYLEGNVIDLGQYKLQVVEACSGLRYLYPLLSLGFLASYFFRAPIWQRAIVLLSTVPITIVMNSFRIGMVGVLVDRWGSEQADGLLHFFEGWVIFLACAGLLAGEIYLFARLFAGKGFFEVFQFPQVKPSLPSAADQSAPRRAPIAASLVLLGAAGVGILFVSGRQEIVPDRTRFVAFPTTLGQWQGRPSVLEPQVEHALGLEDYILADYSMPAVGAVNFYVAYYASQRKGRSPHSPIVCIPGGGWLITKFDRTNFMDDASSIDFPFNRAVIERDSKRQLVYYWFVQRGRPVANEYWSKWYLFTDALLKNRTDGALVRLTTPIGAAESERDADRRLQSFIRELEPRLSRYLPPEAVSDQKSALTRPSERRS
jgi:exosortase D (VPLPA-CTERM-specific)